MTKQQAAVVNKLTGKPFEELSASELEALSAEIETKRKAMREALEKEQYGNLITAAEKMSEILGWEKLPKMALIPDATGKKYEISFASNATGLGKRASAGINGGDITINKIGMSKGGIAQFKDKDGKAYDGIQELVKGLKQADGKPESDRCWDIQHKLGNDKGSSASDIVIKYHADEVTMIYQDGKEKLVKDAVEEAKKARAVA
jgi:hypothetical protein